MKIPNREINIFNMSMLDVVCGALGAFLIVTVVLFPAYQNKATVIVEEVSEVKQQNERLRKQIAKARQAATVPPRMKELERENDKLEKELDAVKKSQASKTPPLDADANQASRRSSTAPPARLTAANASVLATVKNPPLLVWISWERPLWTKHFSVSLGVFPESIFRGRRSPRGNFEDGGDFEEELKERFKKGRLRGMGSGVWIAQHRAPREKPHTVFDEGLEYVLMGNAPHAKYIVTYTVSERSEFPNLRRAPESVTVYGFAVHGKEEIELPEVSFLSRGSSVLVGFLSLDADQGMRFEKVMERKAY